jgi:hypothetical protein
MYVIYSTQVSIFSIILFHLGTSLKILSQYKLGFSIHNHSQTALSTSTTHAALSVLDALDQPLLSSPWMSIRPLSKLSVPFSDTLLWLCQHHKRLSTGSEFRWGKHVSAHKNWITIQTFSQDEVSHIITISYQLVSWTASESLTLEPLVACYFH